MNDTAFKESDDNNILSVSKQIEWLGDVISKKSGLIVQENVREKLTKIFMSLDAQSLHNFVQAYEQLDENSSEFLSIVDNILNNETSFFRHIEQFDFLEDIILPKIWDNLKNDEWRKISILSAGCSYGSEAYSLAICLLRFLCKQHYIDYKLLLSPRVPPQQLLMMQGIFAKANVVGYDISSIHVRKATDGLFRIISSDGSTRDRFDDFDLFLHNVDDEAETQKERLINEYKVHSALQQITRFERMNMRDTMASSERFNVIFCRNMLMYNNEESRNLIAHNLISLLDDNGYIFFGPSDFPPDNIEDYVNKVDHNIYVKQD